MNNKDRFQELDDFIFPDSNQEKEKVPNNKPLENLLKSSSEFKTDVTKEEKIKSKRSKIIVSIIIAAALIFLSAVSVFLVNDNVRQYIFGFFSSTEEMPSNDIELVLTRAYGEEAGAKDCTLKSYKTVGDVTAFGEIINIMSNNELSYYRVGEIKTKSMTELLNSSFNVGDDLVSIMVRYYENSENELTLAGIHIEPKEMAEKYAIEPIKLSDNGILYFNFHSTSGSFVKQWDLTKNTLSPIFEAYEQPSLSEFNSCEDKLVFTALDEDKRKWYLYNIENHETIDIDELVKEKEIEKCSLIDSETLSYTVKSKTSTPLFSAYTYSLNELTKTPIYEKQPVGSDKNDIVTVSSQYDIIIKNGINLVVDKLTGAQTVLPEDINVSDCRFLISPNNKRLMIASAKKLMIFSLANSNIISFERTDFETNDCNYIWNKNNAIIVTSDVDKEKYYVYSFA